MAQVSMVGGGLNLRGSQTGTGGGGSNVFGSKISPIGTPNPYQDLSMVYPNLSGTNAATSSALLGQLHGELSPQTISTIHDQAATFGVGSGMPGSGLMSAKYLKDIGLNVEAQKNLGLQNYSHVLPTTSATQTVRPELQSEIAATNATNAAAPDPAAANSYAQELFDKYLTKLSGPAAGSGGGGPQNMPWYAQGNQAPIYANYLQNQSFLTHGGH